MDNAQSSARSVAAGSFTIYPTQAYFRELPRAINSVKPGGRVLLTTMNFEPSDKTFPALVDALREAAQRGVQVALSMDAHDFLLINERVPGPLFIHGRMPAKLHGTARRKIKVLDNLRQAGVTVGITNQPGRRFTNPFAGRSHIKTTIINNKLFVGGCNLKHVTNIDLMAGREDAKAAGWLYDRMLRMVKTQETSQALGSHDLTYKVGDQTDLLIDAGAPHQSLIYERALAAIDQAQKWVVITCQYFPNSTTALALRRAHRRGVQVLPIFNHYSQHTFPHNLLQGSVTARERLRMPSVFFEGELPRRANPLHAKLIVTEKECLLGSHNYVPSGVNFGTAEIALHSYSSVFAKASLQALLSQTPWQNDKRFASLG